MGKIPPFLNGWAYKYSRLFLFYHQPKIQKKNQKKASPADTCGVTLFYTRGLGIVVSCVMAPQPCRYRTEEKGKKRGKAG
jgi:hypothetical protein